MEFDKETKKSGRARLLLSVVVSAVKSVIDKAYEVEEMTRYVSMLHQHCMSVSSGIHVFLVVVNPLPQLNHTINVTRGVNARTSG